MPWPAGMLCYLSVAISRLVLCFTLAVQSTPRFPTFACPQHPKSAPWLQKQPAPQPLQSRFTRPLTGCRRGRLCHRWSSIERCTSAACKIPRWAGRDGALEEQQAPPSPLLGPLQPACFSIAGVLGRADGALSLAQEVGQRGKLSQVSTSARPAALPPAPTLKIGRLVASLCCLLPEGYLNATPLPYHQFRWNFDTSKGPIHCSWFNGAETSMVGSHRVNKGLHMQLLAKPARQRACALSGAASS